MYDEQDAAQLESFPVEDVGDMEELLRSPPPSSPPHPQPWRCCSQGLFPHSCCYLELVQPATPATSAAFLTSAVSAMCSAHVRKPASLPSLHDTTMPFLALLQYHSASLCSAKEGGWATARVDQQERY